MSEIKPALTAEEWSEFRAGWVQIHDGEDDFIDGEVVWVPVADPSVRITHCEHEFRGKDRHALAALALHGQPFGFTWEDVELIHKSLRWTDQFGPSIEEVADLESLADRIAALLPPRES